MKKSFIILGLIAILFVSACQLPQEDISSEIGSTTEPVIDSYPVAEPTDQKGELQMLNFVKNYGDKLGAKVIVGEAVNNNNKSYTNALLNDAEAVNKFHIAATHLYGSGITNDPLVRQKGKEFWMTEHLFNETNKTPTDPEINWTWKPSLDMVAKEIHDCMAANLNAYVTGI